LVRHLSERNLKNRIGLEKMEKLKLTYFKEEIDIQNLQDEYETELEYNGKEVDVFLNEMQIADNEQFDILKMY